MALDLLSFLPSGENIFTLVAISFIVFLGMVGFAIMVFVMIVSKKKVPINLYIQRAGNNAYKTIQLNAKRFVEKGIHKLKLSKIGVVDKIIPNIENQYLYPTNKGMDSANLVLDNKGFLHKLRIASMDEMLNFFVLKKAISNYCKGNDVRIVSFDHEYKTQLKEFKQKNPDFEIFNVINPHETTEMIARQIEDGDKAYAISWFEKYGVYAVPITAIMSATMIMIMAMILSGQF